MEFDLQEKDLENAYKILTALVSPRPIAWVSTISRDGILNLAPFSFFNVFGSKPPIVAFAPGNKADGSPKDTAQNIIDTEEFVINIVPESLAQEMVNSSLSIESDESEFELTGLTPTDSKRVAPPRVLEAPAALECKLYEVKEIGSNRMIIGTVLSVYANDELFDDGSAYFHQERYDPLGRMASPSWYCSSSKPFDVKPSL